jgi:hypothetical protein
MLRNLLCVASALLMTVTVPAASRPCVDVALVLAVDGSGSVDNEEYELQKSAIAEAFQDTEVLSSLRSAGTVAVAAVFWADGEFPSQLLGWRVIQTVNDAERFAREVESSPRRVFGNTDIGNGIWSALDLLSDPRLCAFRSIINISGDGRETLAPKRAQVATLSQARQRAGEMGVTINALTISGEDISLADYYETDVILGADAFVMSVETYADYAIAIRKKLIRELTPKASAKQMRDHKKLISEDAVRTASTRIYSDILRRACTNGWRYPRSQIENGFKRHFGELKLQFLDQGYTVVPDVVASNSPGGISGTAFVANRRLTLPQFGCSRPYWLDD